MKHIVYIACIALLCVACKSQKLINGNEELMFVPCAAIVSDHFNTRALGTSTSTNMQLAKDKAIASARKELASSMQTMVQSVMDTYANSFDTDHASLFITATKEISRITCNHMLVGSSIACEKVTQSRDKKSGNILYHAYVVMEVDNKQLRENMQKNVATSIQDNQDLLQTVQVHQLDEVFNQMILQQVQK